MHKNPYAWSIPKEYITKRILSEDEKDIKEERQLFDGWCKDEALAGNLYPDQINAWRAYDLERVVDQILSENPSTTAVVEGELHWEDELKEKLMSKVSPKNYNEFGGQQ